MENNIICERHQNHEKYLMMLFLGITISFLVFNSPSMIIGPLTPVVPGCESIEGKLLTSAATFFITEQLSTQFGISFFGDVPIGGNLHKETLKKSKWPSHNVDSVECLSIWDLFNRR